MKKKIVYALGLLALGLLAFYGMKLYNGTHYREEDGTNTNAASKPLDEFFAEIEEYYPDLYEKLSDDKETFTIPGLVQTKTIIAEGEEEGESEQTEDMTPQGLALVENYLIISAYSKRTISLVALSFMVHEPREIIEWSRARSRFCRRLR